MSSHSEWFVWAEGPDGEPVPVRVTDDPEVAAAWRRYEETLRAAEAARMEAAKAALSAVVSLPADWRVEADASGALVRRRVYEADPEPGWLWDPDSPGEAGWVWAPCPDRAVWPPEVAAAVAAAEEAVRAIRIPEPPNLPLPADGPPPEPEPRPLPAESGGWWAIAHSAWIRADEARRARRWEEMRAFRRAALDAAAEARVAFRAPDPAAVRAAERALRAAGLEPGSAAAAERAAEARRAVDAEVEAHLRRRRRP